eukprot:746673-Pyramimonas_sp.AAC.1
MECINIAFLEFGPSSLSKEDVWLCIGAVKSTDVQQCDSGMAQVAGQVLKRTFQPCGFDLRFSGCSTDLPNGPNIRIIGRLGAMLGDEAGLHATWVCKGSAGVKPCCQCLNILSSDGLGRPSCARLVH